MMLLPQNPIWLYFQQAAAAMPKVMKLEQYEEAIRCKSDSHTLQLTFMEACNSNNIPKAKTYWKKLSAELQNRAISICVRNKITREQLEGP